MKKIFSLPYNGDLDLLEYAIRLGQTKEIYFQCPKEHNLSVWDPRGPWPITKAEVNGLIKICNKNNIAANLLCNAASLVQTNIESAIKYIKTLKGLTSITLSDVQFLPYFKAELPRLKIQVSFVSNINTFEKAEHMAKLGADVICLANGLNKNAAELRKIARLKDIYPGLSIKTIASAACSSYCTYFPAHYFFCAMRQDTVHPRTASWTPFYVQPNPCINPVYTDTKTPGDLIRQPFIRPEDLNYYLENGLVDTIKLNGRIKQFSSVVKNKIDSFHARRCVTSDLFDVFNTPASRIFRCNPRAFPKGFVQKVTQCDRDCARCGYCDSIAALAISKK